MKIRHRRLITLAAAPLVLGVAVGCAVDDVTTIANSSDVPDEASSPAQPAYTASGPASDSTAVSTAAPAVTDVDPAAFRIDGDRYGFILQDGRTTCEFDYPADADVSGTCHVRALHGMGGQPAADTVVFDSGDADEGVDAGIYTEASEFRRMGAPGFEVLQPGHRVEIGPIACTALGTTEFSCDMGEHSVTVADGVADGAEFRDNASAGRFETRAMRPLAGSAGAGATCGDVASEEFEHIRGPLRVTAGDVDCAEIRAIIDEYINTPMDAHHGNWNVRQYRNWTCSMPTAATYEREGQHVICGDGTGNTVAVEGERDSRS